MAKGFRGAYILTGGGTGSLDSEPLATFDDLDATFTQSDGVAYWHSFDSASVVAESSPMYIRPDDNAFPIAGVHVLQSIGCNNLILEGGLTLGSTNWTNATHAHLAANSGGQITEASISDLGSYSTIGHSHTESDILDLQSYYIPGGTDVAIADGGTGQSTAQLAINALSAVSGATNEYVLTKDTGTGDALWKVATGGSGLGSNLSSSANDLLSDTGTVLLGGTGNTNNEILVIDCESVANLIGLDSTTSATALTWNGDFAVGVDAGTGSRVIPSHGVDDAIWAFSADTTSTTDWIKFYHGQTGANIDWGSGDLVFNSPSGVAFKTHTFNSSRGIWGGVWDSDVWVLKNISVSTAPSYTFYADYDTGMGRGASNELILYAGGERIRIDSSGNVGIGTSTPNEKLSVEGVINVPKATGNGIKIDTTSGNSGWGWHDIIGAVAEGSGGNKPSQTAYRGTIEQLRFTTGKEVFVCYHLPHDYAPGTDIHLHVHWSCAAATTTGGTVDFEYEASYSKGHAQAAFSAPVTKSFTSATASTTQYFHEITETQLSASSPTNQIDTDDLEVDGIVLCRLEWLTNNLTGGTTQIFIHQVDVHYQSTGIPTKDKTPDFYI